MTFSKDITATKAPTVAMSEYTKKIRGIKRFLKSAKCPIPDTETRRLLQKELLSLKPCRDNPLIKSVMTDDGPIPFLAAAAAESGELTEENIISVLSALNAQTKLNSSDIDTFVWQMRYYLVFSVTEAAKNGRDCSEDIKRIYSLADIDTETLTKELDPLEKLFSADETYMKMTAESCADYRRKTALISRETGIDEARLSFEYINLCAKENRHIGRFIQKDFRRVFPQMKTGSYIFYLFAFSAFFSLLTAFFCSGISYVSIFTALAAFLPWYVIVKTAADRIVSAYVRSAGFLPALNPSEAAMSKAVCVMSVIIPDKAALTASQKKLARAAAKNSGFISYCLLCDLPASDSQTAEADEEILSAAKALALPDNMTVIFREREYSRTQGKYQGKERKRGAIEQLVRFIKGEKVHFRFVCGDLNRTLCGKAYLIALDSDTMPTLNSLDELICIAEHPLNERYGIFAPSMSTTLSSALKTGFTRITAGNTGCTNISAYENASGEFYFDCFGEGNFCGKGLIRIDAFYEKCCGFFPDEKILSHDILEGARMRTAFVGNVEFCDDFPPTTRSFFRRQERWLRGDFQNIPILFGKRFHGINAFRIWDNALRGIAPVMTMLLLLSAPFFANGYILTSVALASATIPLFFALFPALFKGFRFANTREFHSPVHSRTRQLISQILLNIMLIPMNFTVSLKALCQSVWRMAVTKKNLLNWSASSVRFLSDSSFRHLVPAEPAALLLLFAAIYRGDVFSGIVGLVLSCQLPLFAFLDKAEKPSEQKHIPAAAREGVTDCVRRMWRFFEDYTNETTHYLPPDNVQYAPVYRICERTSPTNIGMYLLSCLCARIFCLIDTAGLDMRVSRTLGTVERLEKWHGNLYNWYATDSLKALNGFVSTVDSGNFICSLVALVHGMEDFGCSKENIRRVYSIIDNTDLSPLYDKKRHLFSIGYDCEQGKLSPHHYDLLMSEARMTSYYAVSSGQTEKRHWRYLGRIMSKSGHYAAPVAWTGTMFEYFMPEILLSSKEGSMSQEALRYAFSEQQGKGRKNGVPFGFSESGYYAFDNELNYQYKAHGVQKLALQTGIDEECVVSPYSSFLTLPLDISESYNNLVRLSKAGAFHKRYGFYEAVDYTQKRVGKNGAAIVKSHMAHHVGMSIASSANALYGNILSRYFMSDEKMRRGEELSEERITVSEEIPDIEQVREKPHDKSFSSQNEYNEMEYSNPYIPAVNLLSNGKLTVICADNGICEGKYNGKSTVVKTYEPLLRPRGCCFAFVEGEEIMPFSYNSMYLNKQCADDYERSIAFSQEQSAYYLNYRQLRMGMKLTLHGEFAAEIRNFAIKNTSSVKRQTVLCAYMEPALAHENDIKAHPAFMDLFIKTEYDSENRLFFASRKERHSDNELYMCVGFTDTVDFTYSFNREDVVDRNASVFSAFGKGNERASSSVGIPAPCVFIKADIPLDAHSETEMTMFCVYAESRESAVEQALAIRAGSPEEERAEIRSPLVLDTIHGRMALSLLPRYIFRTPDDKDIISAINENKLSRSRLADMGVPRDIPVALFVCGKTCAGAESALMMKRSLAQCGIDIALVILCSDGKQTDTMNSIKKKAACEAAVLNASALGDEQITLLKASALVIFTPDKISFPPEYDRKLKYLPLGAYPAPAASAEEGNYFCGDEYIIGKKPDVPWCNVLSNPMFGCLVSDSALGFSWALNSRENKLTPWLNDLRSDNRGEMLIVKDGRKLRDIILGAKAVFSPNKADWYSCGKNLNIHTSARVFTKGMGKQVEVEFENTSAREKSFSIAYYTEPVLGAFSDESVLGIRSENGAAVVENYANDSVSGVMTLACAKECEIVTDKSEFFLGHWGAGKKSVPNCAAVVIKIILPPKSTEKVKFILTFTKNKHTPLSMTEAVENLPTEIKYKRNIRINTDNKELNAMFNVWLPWQITGCRLWARTAFYQNGGAYGFRDQLQDCLAAMYFAPHISEQHIYRCCYAQFSEGDVLHWWHILSDNVRKGARTRCSDDMLWLPYTVCEYIRIYGAGVILDRKIRYASGESLSQNEHEKYINVRESCLCESVYMHCKRALDYAYKKGRHGLLLMGNGDWNDGYNNVGIKGKGESVWLSMFYTMVAGAFADIARRQNESSYAEELEDRCSELKQAVEKNCWNGNHYLRAFYDDGSELGAAGGAQCSIDILPQAFATLSGMPDTVRNVTAANSAMNQLVDEKNRIIRLFTPAFERRRGVTDAGYVASYPVGVRENGGQYTHAAVWFAMAVYELGLNDAGYELLKILLPCGRNSHYKNEPYYMSADVYTNPKCYGRGGWSMYTGAAAWYYKCILEKLMGAKPYKGKLTFQPNPPSSQRIPEEP